MEAKGKVLLKVMGIIMIVGGAIGIILSIVLAVAAAALIALGGPGTIIVGIIISILGCIAELIAGIICTKNAAKPDKATKCMVWSIIVIVLQLIGVILIAAGGSALAAETGSTVSSGASTVVSIILGIAVPVLAIIGAVMNKKSYDASRGVQTSFSSLAGDMANEVKEMDDDVVGLAKDAKEKAGDVADDVKEFADKAKDKAEDVAGDVKEFAENAKDKAEDAVDKVKDTFDGKDN